MSEERRAAMPVGTRVRMMNEPWPERSGCVGTIIAPRADGRYPQPSKSEVLVLLDDDPLKVDRYEEWWSCVCDATDLEVIDAAPAVADSGGKGG